MNDQTKAAGGFDLAEYEKLNPRMKVNHNGVDMTFAIPSTFTMWRVQSIHKKEPCTLEWIDSFGRGDVMVDCGANVGMYTIWAAATRGARVYAFEPEAQNYALLNKNIMLNNLSERVIAYCMGLLDVTGLSVLNMNDMRVGGSCHSVGEEVDFRLQKLNTLFRQGCFAIRLDELIEQGSIPVPAHIKIDVDGLEHKVIAGARKTLQDSAVKSLLIETNQNLEQHMGMVNELDTLGFKFDQAQVARAERKEGAFKGVAEYIFRR